MRRRRAAPASALEAPVAGLIIEDGRVAGVRLASGERIAARAVAANVPPKLLFRDLVPEGAVEPELARPLHGPQDGLGHLPHERRAVRAAGLSVPARQAAAGPPRLRHRHRRRRIDYLDRAYTRCATPRLVARAGRRDADPLHARCLARARRQPRGEPVRAARRPAACPAAAAGTRPKPRFADLVIDTVARHAPNFKASVIGTPGALPARPGAPLRHGRRRHLPRPADARSAVLRPPRARPLPTTACPCPASTSVAPAHIRAVVSQACRGAMRPLESFEISSAAAGAPRTDGSIFPRERPILGASDKRQGLEP